MKLKLATIAAAVSMAWTGTAFAAITPSASSGNGALIFSAWDDTGKSFTQSLGVNLNDWLPNTFSYPTFPNSAGDPTSGNRTPNAGFTQAFSLTSVFSQLFPSNSTGFFWNIVAGDQTQAGGNGVRRALVTGASEPGITNSGLQTLTQNVTNFMGAVDSGVQGPLSGLGNGNDGTWGTRIGLGAAIPIDTATAGFGSTNFFYISSNLTSTSGGQASYRTIFQNNTGPATWTLASNGTVTYNIAGVSEPPIPEIPIPAAGWLLLSGLLSLGAIARRRLNAPV